MTGRVVAVSTDLMDRSKLTSGLPGVEVIRPDALAGLVGLRSDDVVIVDLGLARQRPTLVADAVATGARVVAYGSHVDDAVLDAARDAGADAMARSVFFRRVAAGTLLG